MGAAPNGSEFSVGASSTGSSNEVISIELSRLGSPGTLTCGTKARVIAERAAVTGLVAPAGCSVGGAAEAPKGSAVGVAGIGVGDPPKGSVAAGAGDPPKGSAAGVAGMGVGEPPKGSVPAGLGVPPKGSLVAGCVLLVGVTPSMGIGSRTVVSAFLNGSVGSLVPGCTTRFAADFSTRLRSTSSSACFSDSYRACSQAFFFRYCLTRTF